MTVVRHFHLQELAATEAFGRRLGALLFPGSVVGLVGQLGAGKTRLARAIAEGLEVHDARVVTSPTFVLIQEYEGRLPIYHFDVYRLQGAGEFADLGVHEYFQGQGVCLIEWADKVAAFMPAEYLHIHLQITSPTSRAVAVTAVGLAFENLVDQLDWGTSGESGVNETASP